VYEYGDIENDFIDNDYDFKIYNKKNKNSGGTKPKASKPLIENNKNFAAENLIGSWKKKEKNRR
jgi:hypothetical protein